MTLISPAIIKVIATMNGYVERREEASSTLFFREDNQPHHPILINVFYTTNGVMTKLSHPKSGYNQLWRSNAYDSAASLGEIFANPRVHTGQGYRQASGAKRGCIGCGVQKKKADYSKNQWRKGPGNAKCSSCIQQKGNRNQQRQEIPSAANDIQPSDILWNTINDSITCDAEGCSKVSPTIRCQCSAPVYYCSERCKRNHMLEHSEDCRSIEEFRYLTQGKDPNLNSGLCNADPSTLSQMRTYAMATRYMSRGRTVSGALLQAEAIHQADEHWDRAVATYKDILMIGGEDGENASPSEWRQVWMGLSRCYYELGDYKKAIQSGSAVVDHMNRYFPLVHKYIALGHLASGDRDLAIKTMKRAVLYEAHYSAETMQANKELLCKLMNEQEADPQSINVCESISSSHHATVQPRIDVYYGRTDGTPGYKEYTAVVVKTTETASLQYFDDLYEPSPGCDYKIMFEVPPERISYLCQKAGVNEGSVGGWVQEPLKRVILKYWKENPNAQSLGSAMFM